MCQNRDRTEAREKQITDRAGSTQGQSMEHLPRCRRKRRRQGAPLNPGLSPFFVQAPRAACDNHGPTCGPLVLGQARALSTELTAVLGGADGSEDHSLLEAGWLSPTVSYILICLWNSPPPTPQAGAAQGQIPKRQRRPRWKRACLRLEDSLLTRESKDSVRGSGRSPDGRAGASGGPGPRQPHPG